MSERSAAINEAGKRKDTQILLSKNNISQLMNLLMEKFDAIVGKFYKYTT
jgi:hypothetical protein